MMEGFNVLSIVFGVLGMIRYCNGSSEYCGSLYKEGGAPAVFQSQECAFEYLHPKSCNNTTKCQFATLQGRREYQEDRVFCNLQIQINFHGNDAQKNLKIGLAAVFDGHGGKEASVLAAQLLPYYFQLHARFLSENETELSEDKHGMAFPLETKANTFGTHFGRRMTEPRTMELLKQAIMLTIHDIDSTFSQVALTKHLLAGTTAAIVLIVADQLLVANVGDSKALLCSEKIQFTNKLDGTAMSSLQVTELTKDHHPDRDEERFRIKAAGGFVSFSGVPRVNGILAVSRAIGDVYLKRYGVVAEPEFMGWRHLNASDAFTVVASDGIFESLSPQDVCTLLQDARTQGEDDKDQRQPKCLSQSLAECIVNTAFETGSTDNLSAVVVSVRTVG